MVVFAIMIGQLVATIAKMLLKGCVDNELWQMFVEASFTGTGIISSLWTFSWHIYDNQLSSQSAVYDITHLTIL